MQAMILCGGMGTRLREQTETKPKPMIEIGGKPILWHIMKIYAHFGIRDFILCLGYKGNIIKEYFLNYEALNNDFTITLGQPAEITYHYPPGNGDRDWNVTLVDTGEDAMTGARVARAARFLNNNEDTFALTYGDGVAPIDLAAAIAFHRSHNRLATVTGVRPPSRFGELQIAENQVTAFSEKPQVAQGLINGGFFLLEPGFLKYLDDDSPCVLEKEPLVRCAGDKQLMVFEHEGYWQCMDTFRDWQSLEKRWQTGAAPWKVWA